MNGKRSCSFLPFLWLGNSESARPRHLPASNWARRGQARYGARPTAAVRDIAARSRHAEIAGRKRIARRLLQQVLDVVSATGPPDFYSIDLPAPRVATVTARRATSPYAFARTDPCEVGGADSVLHVRCPARSATGLSGGAVRSIGSREVVGTPLRERFLKWT